MYIYPARKGCRARRSGDGDGDLSCFTEAFIHHTTSDDAEIRQRCSEAVAAAIEEYDVFHVPTDHGIARGEFDNYGGY